MPSQSQQDKSERVRVVCAGLSDGAGVDDGGQRTSAHIDSKEASVSSHIPKKLLGAFHWSLSIYLSACPMYTRQGPRDCFESQLLLHI